MKKILFFSACIFIALSCSKKEEPVVADFELAVSGESPNATISITNKSTGATSFKWNFDKGTTDSVSTMQSPATITVDRAGTFTIKLTASNGAEKQTTTKSVTVAGHSAIMTYSNLEFGVTAGSTTYGRYFSFETGKIYKDSEINASNGSIIHLGFGRLEYIFFFVSPSSNSTGLLTIPNATTTKVVNWQANPSISATSFDAMQDDTMLSGLTINGTNDSFDTSLPNMILFQIASGRKGVIKAKAVNSERLLADIKIQKY
jgi:PKD repeat protein